MDCSYTTEISCYVTLFQKETAAKESLSHILSIQKDNSYLIILNLRVFGNREKIYPKMCMFQIP